MQSGNYRGIDGPNRPDASQEGSELECENQMQLFCFAEVEKYTYNGVHTV
jgi:hypothetical protein